MDQIKAKKSYGQNFLINKNIQKKIVDSAKIDNEDVIEIGPGLGAITNLIIPRVKTLVAYELDKDIFNIWNLKNMNSNIYFLNQDFLEANISFKNKRIIIGNIPYNITSPIIFKIIDNIKYVKSATLMVQKEVGLRLLAKPSSKEYSKLSVSVQSLANITKILIANANDFNPAPKVDSMVVKIDFFNNNEIENNLNEYLNFLKKCFQFKRKTLVNNLITTFSKEKIIKILKDLDIDLKSRPENLTVKQYLILFNKFNK